MSPHPINVAELDTCEDRSRRATAAGAQAFAHLLKLAEERNSGQIARVVQFIAATYNGQAFTLDPFDLRMVDIAISDAMLQCLAALGPGRPVHARAGRRLACAVRHRALGLAVARRHVTRRLILGAPERRPRLI